MTKNNNKLSRMNNKGKKKRRLRKTFYILIPLLIILIAGSVYLLQLYNKATNVVDQAYEDGGKERSDLREEDVDPDIHNVSILLLGIDENDKRKQKEVARADAIMVATLNKEDKSVKLLSIPRDSKVYIPEVDYNDKINHAYAFGEISERYNVNGTSAMIETVEELLEVPIDYYMKLNFNAFIEIIDALGGIDVDVPYNISELNSQDEKHGIYLEEGFQTVNGEEALALARTRKQDSDFERGKRQMEIIDSIMDKSMSFGSILKYGDMIDSLEGNMSTNMKFDDMKSFFTYATEGRNLNLEKFSLAGDDYWPGEIYYWQVDEVELAETKNKLRNHLDLPLLVDTTDDQSEDDEASEHHSAESGY